MNKISALLYKIRTAASIIINLIKTAEDKHLILGKILSESVKLKSNISSLSEVEFKVFSQWGDDGIIQWLTSQIEFPNKTFIEFGVSNYRESNTRFLMMNDNWSGLIMDGSQANVEEIRKSEYFWKYDLKAQAIFINKENINELILQSSFNKDVGILHIDLDGNDYWIWKEINCISPILVILEYNSVFGIDRAITVPYDPSFSRSAADPSNLYYGASLKALCLLSKQKGYIFIGSNSAGNNAYFVRSDKLSKNIKELPIEQGFVISKFRESRNSSGDLTYLSGEDRIKAIRGLAVVNTENYQTEVL